MIDYADANINRLLADMAHATAWITFTTAQANHDLQRYGEWRCDYAHQASIFQADYEKAGSALMNCLAEGHGIGLSLGQCVQREGLVP